MKHRNAKLLRQKKEALKTLRAEHSRLVATTRSDDMMQFIVAGNIKKLEAEIFSLES